MQENGPDPAVFLLMPLTEKHVEWFPRFRGVFLEDPEHPEFNGKLQILTRARSSDYEKHVEIVKEHPNYVDMYEDVENDFLTFVLDIPEAFKEDVHKMLNGQLEDTSPEYQAACKKTFGDTPQIVAMLELWFNPPQEEHNIG